MKGCKNELCNTLTYISLTIKSGILKITDLNGVWEGNLEAIPDVFCKSDKSQTCFKLSKYYLIAKLVSVISTAHKCVL